ncbi:MAG: hypothetical protein S4CHLAM7_09280 [Chlamydiae bacterium]|nr:hypothetical protein [Chlamydiota bacterium]
MMQLQHTNLNEIKLAGIHVQTSYMNESKVYEDPNFAYGSPNETSKITPCVMKYFHEGVGEQISNRLNPGKIFCVYTDYESDYRGAYKYFIGEEVSSFENLPDGISTHTIPAQKYAKFTTDPGPMPSVIIDAWKEIWKTSNEQFGAPREYHSDFEVYDERAADHANVIVDLFIGIQQKASIID